MKDIEVCCSNELHEEIVDSVRANARYRNVI